MAKINFLTAYPTATPVASSIVIGSIAANGATNNFLMSDIAAYVMSANTLTLQDVCDNGTATTTGITVGGTTTLNGTVDINNTADISGNTTIGGTLGVTGVSTLGEIDASGVADIADTLTLSKASGTALSVSAGSVYFASNLDVFGLHHQWGALTVEGITTLNNALDANSTADISDTLTLSRATGTGLSVTSNATIGGRLTAGTSVVEQAYVAADAFQTNNSSFTATSSAVQVSFGTTFTTFDATIVSCKITGSAPASASAAGVTGSIVTDADYIYVCTATNTWKRVAIATW